MGKFLFVFHCSPADYYPTTFHIDVPPRVVKQAHLIPQYQSTQSHCTYEIMSLPLNCKVVIMTASKQKIYKSTENITGAGTT